MSTASVQGQSSTGPRPITRAEEGRALAVIHAACNGVVRDPRPPVLHFGPDGNLKTIESADSYGLCAAELAALTRAGIVPGPEGWCWAPAVAVATRPILQSEASTILARIADGLGCGEPRVRLTWENGTLKHIGLNPHFGILARALSAGEIADLERAGIWTGRAGGWEVEVDDREAPPPSWLTAAVAAAFPPDGTPVAATVVNGIPYHLVGECIASIPDGTQLTEAMVGRALSALVMSGEIEVSHDEDGRATWCRWGVPEGWGWSRQRTGALYLAPSNSATPIVDSIANITALDSLWTVTEPGADGRLLAMDEAEDDDAAQRASVRACWERGLFGGAEASASHLFDGLIEARANSAAWEPLKPKSIEGGGRAQRVRDALIDALTREPMDADLLLRIVSGAGLACSLTDLLVHLASIGAVHTHSGVRWRLSDGPPPGWVWRSVASRRGRWLVPAGTGDPRGGAAIACVETGTGRWWAAPPGADGRNVEVIEEEDDEVAEREALMACRRAGLFAPRPTPVQPGPLPDWVRPAPPVPLPAGQALADHIERMIGIRAGESSCETARLVEALAAGIEERAVRACLDRLDERVARGMREVAERVREGMPSRPQAPPSHWARSPETGDCLHCQESYLAHRLGPEVEDDGPRCPAARVPAGEGTEGARGARLRAEAAELRAQEEIDRAERAEAERDAARAEAERLRAALAREQEAYRGAHADSVKRLDKLGRLEPIAAAAERLARAIAVGENTTAINAAQTALCALFAVAPAGTGWTEPTNEED